MNHNLLLSLIDQSDITLNRFGFGKHPINKNETFTFPDFDIFYTISGCYTLIINGKEYTAVANDSFLFPPNSVVTIIANENSKQLFCHFTVGFVGKIERILDLKYYKLPLSSQDLIHLFVSYFKKSLNLSEEGSEEALSALKSIIRIILLEAAEKNTTHFPEKLLACIRFIQANPHVTIKSPTIAEFSQSNSRYFSKYFKKYIGISIQAYIDQVKLSVSKQLLIEKQYSVKETAYELGFSDPFVFSKKFKHYFGISPNEFKKTNI